VGGYRTHRERGDELASRSGTHYMTDNAARNRKVIVEALTDAYAKRDFANLEKWFVPDYIQHNPFIPGRR
jgi:hypothetical protein